MAEEKKHKAGGPKGGPHSDKRTYNPLELVEKLADKAIRGKSAPLKEVTHDDRLMLNRVTGMSVEEFNAHLSAKLRRIADELADEILKKKNEIGANNLAFSLAVATDKLARLDGSSKLAGAAVNIQVNNYGDIDRETLIAQLSGRKPILPARPPQTQPNPAPTPTEAILSEISPPSTLSTDTSQQEAEEAIDKPEQASDSNAQA